MFLEENRITTIEPGYFWCEFLQVPVQHRLYLESTPIFSMFLYTGFYRRRMSLFILTIGKEFHSGFILPEWINDLKKKK